ncbi:heterokaryon incompatibility protein-domain-containing protein [Achaetomium macrosporum]|uniref:Heterokaryon incompatibility protein-domain-containing protein n=1 Tax=Achaetomium macrosporum TaxID=79813 RepID=A0AAN7C4Q3_9PEZI|nr:heterokaryon incompatibility protein-domain-containing protein [Achaetomium macrosporum]
MEPFNEPYQYQPLPTPTSIRVLSILNREERLHVSLRTVDLADEPFFYALSYTWGNPHANGVDFTEHFNAVSEEYSGSQKTPILCDEQILEVQQNLLDVLGELQQLLNSRRANSSESQPPLIPTDRDLHIWIDAICINQHDIDERASQVRIMDKIYKTAAHTIIWLGRADQYTQAAADTIARVAAYPRDAFAASGVRPFRRQDPEVYAKSSLPYTSWMDWCSLAALLKRQWFSRVWIIQETILSRSIVLLCGKHVISWADLVSAARNIEARCALLGWSPSIMFLQVHEIAVPLEHNVLRLADWRDYYHGNGTNPNNPEAWRFTLENLVYDTWIFTSTVPHDKLYGILGLVDPSVRAAWPIDYQSSAEQVFALATKRIIAQSNSLKILSCVQDASVRSPKLAPYPSWTPDYSLPYFNMMCNAGCFSAAGSLPFTPPSPVSVSNTNTNPNGNWSWSRLHLQAQPLDRITALAAPRTASVVNSAMLLDPSWLDLALRLHTPYPFTAPPQRRTEVLWRTLCADQDESDATSISPAPARFGRLFKELLCAMVVVRAELEQEEIEASRGEVGGTVAEECAGSFGEAMKWAREAWSNVLGWDRVSSVEELREKARGMFAGPECGWLVYTLVKLQALAVTEEGGGADTPSWEELERFWEAPSYVMRVKDGAERKLVLPKDAGFANSFRRRYGKRRLFYTEKGYLGLGPASAAVGDVVCILPGAAGPFVLRENPEFGEGYQEDRGGAKKLRLIGESYVHGIMHGEAVEAEGFALEEIELV